ncbi:unnamed protein product [Knipowitschia caucasica]
MGDDWEHSPSEFYYLDELEAPEEVITENNEENTTNSQEEIDNFVADQKAKNTIRKTKLDMNILRKYLKSIGKGTEEIENLPAGDLNHLISKFFMQVKKADWSDYEPNTISSFQRSIQRYLEGKKSNLNILKDKEFNSS